MRLLFLTLGVFAIALPAQPTQAGIMDFLFPSLREREPDPSETLVAPFAQGSGAEEKEKLDAESLLQVPLDKPHLSSKDIAAWIANASGEVMQFDAKGLQSSLQENAAFFERSGLQQFQSFLQQNRVSEILSSGRFDVRSYVEAEPLLLNQGVVDGRYRWLYRLPIVVTYMPVGTRDYEDVEPTSQRFVINAQVGRIDSPEKHEGMQIEQWSGKVEAFDQ